MGNVILLLASTVSTLGGLVFGYEMGIISGALLQLKVEFQLSSVQQEAVVSSMLIGALLSSIVGGYLIDTQGRRKSIILSNILILIGSLVLLISSYPALLVGRIIVGFSICLSSMSCCIYVSELVAPNRRGFLVTLYEAGVTVGILSAYAVNYILTDLKSGWKWMFGLAIAPALIQLVCVWFLQAKTRNSPYQKDCSQAEQDLLTQESDGSKVIVGKIDQYNTMCLFQRQNNMRTRTVIGLALVLFQQFTGQPNVLYYASTIFHSVGFHSDSLAVLATVGLGLVKVIATLTAMVVSDRVGRRPLLISGCCVMALSLITIGLLSGQSVMDTIKPCGSSDVRVNRTDLPHITLFNQSLPGTVASSFHRMDGEDRSQRRRSKWMDEVNKTLFHEDQRLLDNKTQTGNGVFDPFGQNSTGSALKSSQHVSNQVVNWIILLCMMAFVSAYSTGFGPMTWLLLSEIFPTAIRGRAFAFTNCFNWAANLLVTFTFLNFIDLIGLSGMFFLYGVIAVAAAVFFHFMLPETKGKTLDEIDRELRSNRFYHNKACCGNFRSTYAKYQRVQSQSNSSE